MGNSQGPSINYVHDSPQSIKSKLIKFLFRALNFKANITKGAFDVLAGHLDKKAAPEPPAFLLKEFEVTSWKVEGRNVFRLSPKQTKSNKCILFLHGGGYVANTSILHWNFIHNLIKSLNCTVVVPDYPLADFNTYKDTFAMLDLVYKQLVSEVESDDFILMGDSAGGGISLALALKMKNENIRQPVQIILLSPWLDIACNNPDMKEIEKVDLMLEVKGLRVVGKAYTGDLDPNHYLVSPINGDFENLGRISIFIGTHDVFWPDCKKLKDICEDKEIKINYFEYPNMFHAWMLINFLPEAQKAVEQIKNLIVYSK